METQAVGGPVPWGWHALATPLGSVAAVEAVRALVLPGTPEYYGAESTAFGVLRLCQVSTALRTRTAAVQAAAHVEALINRTLKTLKPYGSRAVFVTFGAATTLFRVRGVGESIMLALTKEQLRKIYHKRFLMKLHPNRHHIEANTPQYARWREAYELIARAYRQLIRALDDRAQWRAENCIF